MEEATVEVLVVVLEEVLVVVQVEVSEEGTVEALVVVLEEVLVVV